VELDHWERRARTLEDYEGKHFLLLQERRTSISWPDADSVGDVVRGMPRAGELTASGVFPVDSRERA
jgi:hypothetical protein